MSLAALLANLRRSTAGAQRGRAGSLSAAAAAAAAAGGCCWAGRRSTAVQLEDCPAYEPPPRLDRSFASLPRSMPADDATQLAWAVKHLEVDRVRDLLAKWPHSASLLDSEDNTLFHLAASEPDRCAARPADAAEVVRLLLRGGWDVVDLKNRRGERAELVAARADPAGPTKQLLQARSHDWMEPLRTQKPLVLVGEQSPTPWMWHYLLQDEQRRSWAGAYFRAVPKETCEEWMKIAVDKGHWVGPPDVPRKVAWYVSPEFADCPYRYSGLEYPPTVFPPWMQDIRKEVCQVCGIPPEQYPNSCNVNIYPNHKGEVGWHSDDEVMFQGLANDTRIISFSLGSPRDFCWRLQGTTEAAGTMALGDGDIMTMEGLFQKHYKHSVLASEIPCGRRINFTFRWIQVKAHAADAQTKGIPV